MTGMPKKKKFRVEQDESPADCLARMRQAGYTPVRRMEQPVFIEREGERVVDHQEIIFEGRKMEE